MTVLGEDKALTRRECDRCPLHQEVGALKSTIDGVKGWVGKIDNRLWAFGVALVIVLLTGIVNMVINLNNRPNNEAIAQQVISAMRQPHP